ncbi:ArsR/SmtB family transcription factor [Streptomyces sp. NBC_01235]|uniref:ArsR/SmtB family transcription factor n=1 Tax=Streptomyces sp. NBC_01235 TaxID=2903788 RepID=UPI002E11E4EC|nr:helix-turn-helix domain-containing protein [Streptomyces sp. NBC_01235]
MWETILSLHQLVGPNPFFASWKRIVCKALADAGLGQDVQLLTAIIPISSYFPDFLTPPGHSTALDAGIDEVLSTSRCRLRTEIERLVGARGSHPSTWLAGIGAGSPPELRLLGAALRRYHAVALAPYAPATLTWVSRDAARRAQLLVEQGSEALLNTLSPGLRWRPPVLEVTHPVTQNLQLAGRGLHLIPSFFCHNHPIGFACPELPPVLIYPVARPSLWIPQTSMAGQSGRSLEELIGPTRAAALRFLGTGHSTTTLATRLRVSASTASRHAAALRRSGLVATERLGCSVLHTRTLLGTALVHGG